MRGTSSLNSPEYNLKEVEFNNLPKEKVVLVMNLQVFKSETNHHFIKCLFKEYDTQTPKYHIADLSLNSISSYPFGIIFKNQRVTNEFHSKLKKYEIKLHIDTRSSIKAKDIYILKNKLTNRILEHIDKNSLDKNLLTKNLLNEYLLNQNYYIYQDLLTNKKVIIPHYEVARWYYLKSSSLTRQILSDSTDPLDGLQKEAKYLDEEKSEGLIKLKYGANNNDAFDIFRFKNDKYAKKCFNLFSDDLSKTIYSDDINKMAIYAKFPCLGELNLAIRGFELEDKLFLYSIIEEDSKYPFENLKITREKKSGYKNQKLSNTIKRKIQSKQDSIKVVDETPSSENESIDINKDNTIFDKEKRRGLDSKKIEYKTVDREEESDLGKLKSSSTEEYDLSFKPSSSTGDENVVKTNLKATRNKELEEQEQQEDNRVSDRIKSFFDMLEIASKDENIYIISLSNMINLPQKSFIDNSKRKWKKSKLIDRVTPRKYAFARVNYMRMNFCIIEVESDELLPKLSTLIISKKDNNIIDDNLISSVMKNFVQENGRWLHNYNISNLAIDSLKHPDLSNGKNIESWANRLLKHLEILSINNKFQ